MNRSMVVLTLALSCAFLVSACKKPGGRAQPPTETKEPPSGVQEEVKVVKKVDPRQEKLQAEYDSYGDVVLTHSARDLSEDEKKMMKHLLQAAKLIEELHMLQIHRHNLDWRDRIMASGTDVEKKVFTRYQMPWCGDDTSAQCCALEDCPDREIGAVHWPPDLTEEEFEKLGQEPNGKELLSPFTMVRRKTGGGYHAVPYTETETFGPRMKKVATALRAAAQTAPDESLKKFLESRADAFEAKDAFPYDQSDYDWIALEGDWEVTVGPYETYKNPHQLKALFEMYIGHEDREITAELGKFKQSLQEMENALGELVGKDIYKSRKLDPRISIRAVDIWMASGDGRRDRGATVAFHLPNRGESVDEGLYKKVIMVNHSMAFENVMKARAQLVLDRELMDNLDIRADITNVTFHEFAHGFGAYHEMEVKTPDGEKTTVKEALREYDSLFEELKADTFGLWLLSFQKKKGWVDEKQEIQRYTSALMHILGLLQYPLSGTYPRMVAIQLGWYLDRGAVTWDAEQGRFSIDYAKMPEAVESLAKKVATIQLTGDYEAAKELYEKYIVDGEDGEHALEGTLGEARQVMMDKFKQAGIKSPSLRYEVTDL